MTQVYVKGLRDNEKVLKLVQLTKMAKPYKRREKQNETMEKGNGMATKCVVYTGDGADTEYTGESGNYN